MLLFSLTLNYPELPATRVKRNDPKQGEDSTRGVFKCSRRGSSTLAETASALRRRYVLQFKKQDIPLMGRVPGDSHSTASSAIVA